VRQHAQRVADAGDRLPVRKIAALQVRRHFGEGRVRILRLAGALETQAIDVGRIDGRMIEHVVTECFGEQDGDGVGLFARRAARRPDAQPSAILPARRPALGQMRAQGIPRFDVAEELGDVDRERVEQLLVFPRVVIEQAGVVGVTVHAAGAHAHRDAALQAFVFVGAAADPALA
jgi:hypothetical protein